MGVGGGDWMWGGRTGMCGGGGDEGLVTAPCLEEWVSGGSFVEAALFLQAFLPPPLLSVSPLPPLPRPSKISTTLYWFL